MKKIVISLLVLVLLAACAPAKSTLPQGKVIFSFMGSHAFAFNAADKTESSLIGGEFNIRDDAISTDAAYFLSHHEKQVGEHPNGSVILEVSPEDIQIVKVASDYSQTMFDVPESIIPQGTKQLRIKWTDGGLYLYAIVFTSEQVTEIIVFDVANQFNVVGTAKYIESFPSVEDNRFDPGLYAVSRDGMKLLIADTQLDSSRDRGYYLLSVEKVSHLQTPVRLNLTSEVELVSMRFSPDVKQITYLTIDIEANPDKVCLRSYWLEGLLKGSSSDLVCKTASNGSLYMDYRWSLEGNLALFVQDYALDSGAPHGWGKSKSEIFICDPSRAIGPFCSEKNIAPSDSVMINSVVWSPDGRWLAVSGATSTTLDYYMIKIDGSEKISLASYPSVEIGVPWTHAIGWIK